MANLLIDPHGRVIDYMRISITDLCNLRCIYCMPPEGIQLLSHSDILSYEEILTIIRVARSLGIRKIRITGGEPLVRRGVLEFISRLTRMSGIEDVALTTNGVLLARMAGDLKAAGLNRINVSLDSLRRETFHAVTGMDRLGEVLAGIETALEQGFDLVKINVVLLQGVNEADLPAFARLTLEKPIDVRFIERMPFGMNQCPNSPDPLSALKAREIIRRELGELHPVDRNPLDGPATMFRLEQAVGRVGIIDPVTGHFCGTCNRIRLTARGALRPCLLGNGEIDIKSDLRRGVSDQVLADTIRRAVLAKPMAHSMCIPEMNESMSRIGG
ncbi:MAG TPA: GTP 3',8-cyclase MoaA [Desulfomonilaceae bacterium]|nr:GTP 3',8-cyclase MoaA [Desulfomonilaceae bacterium]